MTITVSKTLSGESPIGMISMKFDNLPTETAQALMTELFDGMPASTTVYTDKGNSTERHDITWTVKNNVIMIKIDYTISHNYGHQECKSELRSQALVDLNTIADTLKTAFSVFA
jgi:hypothetical protein